MATQSHVSMASSRFGGITTARDRTRSFKAARRHSMMVRLMKLGLPLAALGVGALYIPTKIVTPQGELAIEKFAIDKGGLKMINPRFKGVHEKHGVYDVRADTA